MKRMTRGKTQINMGHTNKSKTVNVDKANPSQKEQNKTKIADTKGKEVKANLTKDNKDGKGKNRNGVPRPKTAAGKQVDSKDEHMFSRYIIQMFDRKITF